MKSLMLIMLFAVLLLPQAALAAAPQIGWIPTLEQGMQEARQTSKPIMLMAGAPSCGGVPGVW